MSACEAPKERRTLRPKSPCCPVGGYVKAAPLRILPPGYCEPNSSNGTPGTKFGRGYSAMPSSKTSPPITFTGGAVLAKIKASTDQPPNAAWANAFACGEGRL